MDYKMIDFLQHGDDRGMLISLEENSEIPFAIKRVYYMYDTNAKARRGYHAHKSLRQILVCVNGECTIHLDDGHETQEILLNQPDKGLFIANNIWREIYNFSKGAVLLVLASEIYDENDYIRDYQKFVRMVQSKDAKSNT